MKGSLKAVFLLCLFAAPSVATLDETDSADAAITDELIAQATEEDLEKAEEKKDLAAAEKNDEGEAAKDKEKGEAEDDAEEEESGTGGLESVGAYIKRLDKNKDGKLSEGEIFPYDSKTHDGKETGPVDHMAAKFSANLAKIDTDGDSLISKKEVPSLLQWMQKEDHEFVFQNLDGNKDGKLTEDEIFKLPKESNPEGAKKMIAHFHKNLKKIDIDGDSMISLAEMPALVQASSDFEATEKSGEDDEEDGEDEDEEKEEPCNSDDEENEEPCNSDEDEEAEGETEDEESEDDGEAADEDDEDEEEENGREDRS